MLPNPPQGNRQPLILLADGFSSIDARSLLLGKLLGLGAAGLLQVTIWLSMAVVPLLLMIAGMTLSPMLVILCLFYFVLGFLLYGTLITATGVIGTTAKDMQQLGMFWAIGVVAPMWFFEVLLRKPNSTTARILSSISDACKRPSRTGLDRLASTWRRVFSIETGAAMRPSAFSRTSSPPTPTRSRDRS